MESSLTLRFDDVGCILNPRLGREQSVAKRKSKAAVKEPGGRMQLDTPILPQWRAYKRKGVPARFVRTGPNGEDLVSVRAEFIKGIDVLFDRAKSRMWKRQVARLRDSFGSLPVFPKRPNAISLGDFKTLLGYANTAIAQSAREEFIADLFPDLANVIRHGLFELGEWKLIGQVDELRMERLCGCGERHCASFYVRRGANRKWKKSGKVLQVPTAKSGMIILDVVRGEIRFIEVLLNPPFRKRLVEAVRSMKLARGIKGSHGARENLTYRGRFS